MTVDKPTTDPPISDMPAEHEPRDETSPSGDLPHRLEVRAYAAPARVFAVALQALAALNILYVAAHLVLDIIEGTESAPPLIVAMGVALFSGVPLAAGALLHHLLTATVDIQPPLLVLALRRTRFEIPLASITAIRPWRLPLPGPGLTLEMKSGRRFRYRLELADPGVLLSALGPELPSARAALGQASIAYAGARHLFARRRWVHGLVKFGLFPLVLAVILFRLHQYIVYGDAFGQYHLFGLGAYLQSFGTFWAGTTGGLVVYAGIFRLFGEAVALLLTWALPSRARVIRRSVEALCGLAYFGLVPAYVLARLLL